MSVKEILNSKNSKISIGITDHNTLIEVEDILIKGGYRWRGDVGKYYLKDRKDKITNVIIYLNPIDIHYNYKHLTYNPFVFQNVMDKTDILVTKKTLDELKRYFKIIPDYSSKKFIREI
jgi:hypothetical protein